MKDLETFSDAAALNATPFVCLENLQEQIVKAEELQLSPEQLQESYQAIEVVKNRVDIVSSLTISSICLVNILKNLQTHYLKKSFSFFIL